jgi:alanine dehydrogenase
MVGGNLLTALRTAAASRGFDRPHLARPDARVLGIVGAGHQAGLSAARCGPGAALRAGHRLEPPPRDAAETGRWRPRLGLPFEAVDAAGRMREADVIITITSSPPHPDGRRMSAPGTHMACMGTDTKGKQEVEPALVARARVFTDEIAQS